jgi:hypothetical protein
VAQENPAALAGEQPATAQPDAEELPAAPPQIEAEEPPAAPPIPAVASAGSPDIKDVPFLPGRVD